MASFKKDYSAFFFKKDHSLESKTFVSRRDQNDEANLNEGMSNNDETSSKAETSSCDESCDETGGYEFPDETRSKNKECNKDEIEDFKAEDNLICRLYRQVVDDIMDSNSLTESMVNTAIREMKMKLLKAHKRGNRKFPLIDFSKTENCCAYLRRYAICYTGLVKKMMWNFFMDEENETRTAKNDIINNNYLKVVSLGGGPGNDLVGFCSALHEIPHNANQQIKLTVVDNGTGWKHVFPKILQNAKDTNFGSFSQCAQKNPTVQFIKADLTNCDVFRNENLSATLNEADLLLMVKFVSYLANDVGPETLLHNVIDSMKPNAKFIFIDYPYDGEFFKGFKSLSCVCEDSLKYEISFKPKKHQSPSIASTFAHVAVYQKNQFQYEDSSSSEDN